MSRGCCGSGGVRLIEVAGDKVGLTGLDAILERFYLEGWSAGDPRVGDALVTAVREARNYIAPGREPAYAAALREVFREFSAASEAASGRKAKL